MPLKTDPTYTGRRTYVVKFRSDVTADVLCGRVENLITCQRADFTSQRELIEWMARDIAACGSEPPNDSSDLAPQENT